MTSTMPWHPFLVHFPIALWLTGSLWLVGAVLLKKETWQAPAWVLLLIATLASIPAALAGQNEFAARAIEDPIMARHQDMGNLLPWLMAALMLLKAHTSLRKEARPLPNVIWCILVLAVSVLVLYTAQLGGALVYGVLTTG